MGAHVKEIGRPKYTKGKRLMKPSEISAIAKLRNEGLKFAVIARRLKMSVDQVKRRWYARSYSSVTTAISHPDKVVAGLLPKILFFDIENTPIRGWVWKTWEDNLIRTDHDWYMLSFAAKWAHEDDYKVFGLPDFPRWKKDRECDHDLVKLLHKYLDEADIIVAHNGDAFDIKKSNARFIQHGMNPPSTYKTIDTLKMARTNFKFSSNRLNDLGQYLKVGKKLPHTGADLWFDCMKGDKPESWVMMKDYNIQDVKLLEEVYYKLRPWAKSHPNMNLWNPKDDVACPKCQSIHVQKRGIEIKVSSRRQRFQCQDCGGWFTDGKPLKKDDHILGNIGL